jgi:hypothetical protein
MSGAIGRNFPRATKANVTSLFALALVPLVYLGGMAFSYSAALEREHRLDGIANAAAQAGVSQPSDKAALRVAGTVFTAGARKVTGIDYAPQDLAIGITNDAAIRIIEVRYKAKSASAFPGVLGQTTISISGGSRATGTLLQQR